MIVIGDIHGQYDMLIKLLDILPQKKDICFVGDIIDRGPDSKKVYDLIRKNNYISVMGNHEDMAINGDYNLWRKNGAESTIESFKTYDNFKESGFLEWVNELPYFIEYKNYLISHSYAYNGLDTYYDDVLWGRDFRKKSTGNFINIFGHTPVKNAIKIYDKHWNIDTGATFNNKLSAIDLDDNEKIYYIEK